MKKTILIMISTLIAVAAALSYLGSKGEYAPEKLLYRAMKANGRIAANPDVAPPALLVSVESDLRSVLQKYPASMAAKSAGMYLAEFYLANKKYAKALELLDTTMKANPENLQILSSAQYLKGLVYEKQNKWDLALKEYAILQDKYTNTQFGLEIPMYIARHYAQKDMSAHADKAYARAIVFYSRLRQENKGKQIGYISSNLLAQCCMNLRKHEEAGRVVEDIIKTYPSESTYLQYLPAVEMIFVKTLKRPDKALAIYKSVENKIRNPQAKKVVRGKIQELEKKN